MKTTAGLALAFLFSGLPGVTPLAIAQRPPLKVSELNPHVLTHSLTFITLDADSEFDYEFKNDPDMDTGTHLIIYKDQCFQIDYAGGMHEVANAPKLTAQLPKYFYPAEAMQHTVTHENFTLSGELVYRFQDNPDCSKEVHVIERPDGTRFRVYNDGRIEQVSSDIINDPQGVATNCSN